MLYRNPKHNFNLADPFFSHTISSPDRTALVVDDKPYSYADLALRSSHVAGWLKNSFGSKQVNVGILAERSIATYTGVLGTAWAGMVYVPLNIRLPSPYLRSIIERADLDALIIDDKGGKRLADGLLDGLDLPILAPAFEPGPAADLPVVGESQIHQTPPLTEPVPVAANDLAYIVFTSGSTGTPKGIAPTVANVTHFLAATQKRYQLGPDDRFSQFNDLHWDPSVFDLFSAWYVGASVHVVPSQLLIAPASFIQRQQLTVWYSAPLQISLLSRMKLLKPGAFPSLRLSLFVGEPLLHSAAAAWQSAAPNSLVENVYGPTETTVVCLGQPCNGSPASITPERDFVAIGTPYDEARIVILDAERNVLPPNETGEIAISGPQVTPGYWKDPALTRERFVSLPHSKLGESTWYLTGDHGYRTTAGTFHFLGRIDNQVQINGLRLELEEIEVHLRLVSGSREVAVIGWPIQQGLVQGLVGILGGQAFDIAEIKARLKQVVPSHMIPRRLLAMDQLPRNANNKIDRNKLRELLREGL